jgi:hypothetical protein
VPCTGDQAISYCAESGTGARAEDWATWRRMPRMDKGRYAARARGVNGSSGSNCDGGETVDASASAPHAVLTTYLRFPMAVSVCMRVEVDRRAA